MLIAPLGALVLVGAGGALGWFIAYLSLLVVSWAIDPALARHPADLDETVRRAFFALNVAGVSLTASFVLQYFVHQRNRAMEALDREHVRSERLLLNVLPAAIADRLKDRETIADRFDHATVLFADVVDFTPFAESLAPETVVVSSTACSRRSSSSPSSVGSRRSRRSVTRTWWRRACRRRGRITSRP